MKLVSVETYLKKGKMEDNDEDFEDKIFEDKEDLEKYGSYGMRKAYLCQLTEISLEQSS